MGNRRPGRYTNTGHRVCAYCMAEVRFLRSSMALTATSLALSAMALRLSGFIGCVAALGFFKLGVAAHGFFRLVSIGVASSCLVASCARSWPLSRQGAWHPPVSRLVPQAGCVRLSPPSGCSSSCVTCELGLFCFSSVVWCLRDTSREYCGNCQLSSCVFSVFVSRGSGLGFASPVCFPVGSFPLWLAS